MLVADWVDANNYLYLQATADSASGAGDGTFSLNRMVAGTPTLLDLYRLRCRDQDDYSRDFWRSGRGRVFLLHRSEWDVRSQPELVSGHGGL
jgi:hypothetical protein